MHPMTANLIQFNTDADKLQTTIENFLSVVAEVPWGNSDFQNKQSVVNRELTPERAYRHASLRIMNRLQALNEAYYSLKKSDIEVRKLERKLTTESDDLERELIQLEIDKTLSTRSYTQKLVADAIQEVKSLEPIIAAMGKLSRERFEDAEPLHFKKRYKNQLEQKSDALLGMEAMGHKLELQAGVPKLVDLKRALYDEIVSTKLFSGDDNNG